MTYRLNKFDGSVLTDVIDGTIDQITTDLTLIGSDVSGYGELINENFIHLLENFAHTDVPENPITGQLWYDLSESLLKIYDGTQFTKVAGAILENSATAITPKPGDLWIKQDKGQLWFHDGTGFRVAGPIFEKNQGKSGFEVKTVRDTQSTDHVILCLWCGTDATQGGTILAGIFSNDSFTPHSPIYTYDGVVNAGFTLLRPNVSNDSARFHVQAIELYKNVDYLNNITLINNNSNLLIDVTVNDDDPDQLVSGNIDVNGAIIKNAGIPDGINDVVNIQFYKVYHTTASTNDTAIINELEILAPHVEYIVGMEAHVYCSSVPERRKYKVTSSSWIRI